MLIYNINITYILYREYTICLYIISVYIDTKIFRRKDDSLDRFIEMRRVCELKSIF